MSDYTDRLRQPVYRSLSGATFVLQFDDVERSGGKKAAVHEFPQQDAASVQDLGNQEQRFPMTVYFTGADYDQQADAFWQALSERGAGALQHPRYGDIPVLPLSWSQTEKWVDGVGRADFRVEFIRSPDTVAFPITVVAIDTAISAGVASAIELSVEIAAGQFFPINAADIANIKNQALFGIRSLKSAFDSILSTAESIQAEFNALFEEITSGIDELIAAPGELYTKMAQLASIPAQIVTSVSSKVDSYIALFSEPVPEELTNAQAINIGEMTVYPFGALAVASTIGDIQSRGEAVAISDKLSGAVDTFNSRIELVESASPSYRQNQAILAQLKDSMDKARASLLDRSYSLKTERRVTLASERTPIDLLSEFFANEITDLDAALDDFILSNGLKSDEIILVPAGREVVYYV
jgi:hypothetical protein